jgi:small subunit ribosomal protein S3
MGQKIHPLGFRLNITQTHRSQWFNKPKQYSSILQEDFLIRNYLNTALNEANLSRINLIRGMDRIVVEVHVGQPKLVTGENGARLKELTQGIQQTVNKFVNQQEKLAKPIFKYGIHEAGVTASSHDSNEAVPVALMEKVAYGEDVVSRRPSIVSLQIIQVTQPATDARLVAKKVAEQLEKRVAFRRVMKQSVQAAREAGIDGIKIQIAGRLNGAEIARTEWIREGRVPLHTLQADIDYCSLGAQTIYGTLGIKVWLFKK